VFDAYCQVSSLSVGGDWLAFARTDDGSPAEVWLAKPDSGQARQLTSINKTLVDGWRLSRPETVHYESFDGTQIEGWLMQPVDFDPGKKYPMILSIHGGPHGMYGYAFNHANQVYAARGYAVLYLNPRGSSGYGQKFSDGCINNWGGADYKDLMKGVDYAISANPWIDRARLGVIGGSYGGFMTNWIITQTDQFKAAVSIASVSNLISFYGTSLYQDLIHAEFSGFPWDNYDLLWRYSPIHYVKSVTTPTMFVHGEQDNDVHITQAEEMYMGLKRRGIESVFVRYPREGHGNREPTHRLDQLERILKWFDRHLSTGNLANGKL
jgi:dipeptidyl aminopeptidase/acylaminoacyl peptidase